MPTYKIDFKLVHTEGNRTFREEEKHEIVMAKNRSYAELYVLQKYNIKEKSEIFTLRIEPVTENQMDYNIN